MKSIIVLAALLSVTVSFAISKEDLQEARQEFRVMSAAQALMSDEFEKQYWNKLVPGTSTWYNPTKLCISGGLIQTTVPVSKCVEWTVRLRESSFGKMRKTFTNFSAATSFADDHSNAKGTPTCTQKTTGIASGPMNYTVRGCTLWSKTNDGEKKFYTSSVQAKRVDADCVEWGPVARSISPNFRVTFYADRDRDAELGSHTYRLASCGHEDLPPVPAN